MRDNAVGRSIRATIGTVECEPAHTACAHMPWLEKKKVFVAQIQVKNAHFRTRARLHRAPPRHRGGPTHTPGRHDAPTIPSGRTNSPFCTTFAYPVRTPDPVRFKLPLHARARRESQHTPAQPNRRHPVARSHTTRCPLDARPPLFFCPPCTYAHLSLPSGLLLGDSEPPAACS